MPWTSMLGLGLLTDNLDVKLFDFDFIFFLDIDQESRFQKCQNVKSKSLVLPYTGLSGSLLGSKPTFKPIFLLF